MGHEICYFCHHDFDRHECYPLFGKYYICRECQEAVKLAISNLIKVQNNVVIKDEA